MQVLRIALARSRALVRRDVVWGEIREEMQFHLQMRCEEYERQGLSRDEARRMAAMKFGNLAVMHDRGYDVRGGGIVETILQDIRYGLRLLWKQRSFSLVAILTLALGIGVSTALFSVIDAALLRPLPYPHPEQLVEMAVQVAAGGQYAPSIADFREWRASGRILTHAGGGRTDGFRPLIVDAGVPERVSVGEASEDFLDVYGITPLVGRSVRLDDVREGGERVALLGYRYWQRRLGGASDAVGRTIRIENVPATIVGILPPGFYDKTAVWQPTKLYSAAWVNKRGTGMPTIGRLAAGVTLTQAERELTDLANRAAEARGESEKVRVKLTSMYDEETSGYRSTVTSLAWACGLILLIACVNVAGLLLARGATRTPELAVRASLGAGRFRLVRQLFTEYALLACAGGALGVLLAWLALDALVGIIPMSLPANTQATINPTVLLAAAAASIASAMLFGLLPAFRLSRVRIGAALAAAGRRHGTGLPRRGGRLLIAGEVALALILLAGAGLMVRSFARLTQVDVGFDPAAVLTMEVEPVDPSPEVRREYYASLLTVIRAMPEVASVGATNYLPLRSGSTVVRSKGENGTLNLHLRQVTPGYFESLGLTLKQGRLPGAADATGNEPIALLNETATRKYFPKGSPVGQFVELYKDVPRQVIGIVGNVRHYGPRTAPDPEIYLLYGQRPPEPLTMVIRTREGAGLPADRLRKLAEVVGPRVLIGPIRYSTDDLSDRVVNPRRRTLLLGLLAALGLTLTLVGVFSMTGYAVTRRTQEIGIRMAFGADPGSVVRTMVRETAWPTLLGLGFGIVGAYYATAIVKSFLFETTPHDPATFASVAALMGTAALVAAWLPARRAARVDPVVALRVE
jgi:putative ABC transport system permease protein